MKRRRTIIVEERSVVVGSDEGNENGISATNSSIQAVDDNEETSGETQILTVEDRDNLLPIITEQDAEIEDEDFGQAVNSLNKDCENKLLEATERLAETTDQLTHAKSQQIMN